MPALEDMTLAEIQHSDVETQIEAVEKLWNNIAATSEAFPVMEEEKRPTRPTSLPAAP